LEKKLLAALGTRMPPLRAGRVFELCLDPQRWERGKVRTPHASRLTPYFSEFTVKGDGYMV
jgi:hypothetical protein